MVSFETACCDDHFAGLPDPALLPWLCYALVFCSFCEQVSEKNMRYDNRAGVRDRTHLFSPFIPQSHHPGQGHIRQSPAGYFHLTHQGLDGTPPPQKKKKWMLQLTLCSSSSFSAWMPALQHAKRVVSHASWVESHGHSLQGCSRRGVSYPENTGPNGDMVISKQHKRRTSRLHGENQGSDSSGQLWCSFFFSCQKSTLWTEACLVREIAVSLSWNEQISGDIVHLTQWH